MEAGISDHVWSTMELLHNLTTTFRIARHPPNETKVDSGLSQSMAIR